MLNRAEKLVWIQAGRLSQGAPETPLHVYVEEALRSDYEMKILEAENIQREF